MKKGMPLLVLLFAIVGTMCVKAQTTESHSFSNVNRSIPDGNASGLSDVRTVSSAIANLSSMRVRLHVAGEFNGDLYAYVRHIHGGTTNFCVLLNRAGRSASNAAGYADAGFNTTFDDLAANGDIHLYRAVTNPPTGMPLNGTWQPDGRRVDPLDVFDTTPRTTTLSSFNGIDASGSWTLYLADLESGGTNMLVDWGLELTGIATPTVAWPTPADIVYGTALGGTQLNAAATFGGTNVPGSFSYTPGPGTILDSGSGRVLTAVFTPSDTSSFSRVTNSVVINVTKASITIAAQNNSRTYGDSNPSLSGTITGVVNDDNITASYTTAASTNSPVGSYAIVPMILGDAATNYSVALVNGTLNVTAASSIGVVTSSLNPAPFGSNISFTMTLSAMPPGAGTPTGTVQFKLDGTNFGGPVPLSNGAASYNSSTLTHGAHAVAVEYAGDGNFIGTTNSLLQTINTPPVAGADIIERDPTNSVKVAITTLLNNDIDADGDAITFLGASATSAHGGTVVSNAGWIFYTPAPGFTNTDAFTYTIRDSFSQSVTGLVTVNIRADNGPSPNLSILSVGNGSYQIWGDGIPQRAYHLQAIDQLGTTNWQTLGTVTGDTSGLFFFLDITASPQRFYRTVYP